VNEAERSFITMNSKKPCGLPGVLQPQQAGIAVASKLRAGGLRLQHNQNVGVTVRTALRAGGVATSPACPIR
jgi:hypothetical protein